MNINECKISIIEDADSRVDEQEIRKRVAYSRSVRLKTVSTGTAAVDYRFSKVFLLIMVVHVHLAWFYSFCIALLFYIFKKNKSVLMVIL